MNVTSLDAESFTLAPGHILRRGQTDEIALIKSYIEQFAGGFQSLFKSVLWEGKWPTGPDGIESLPEAEWRYFGQLYI
jgi:hypothetical protein